MLLLLSLLFVNVYCQVLTFQPTQVPSMNPTSQPSPSPTAIFVEISQATLSGEMSLWKLNNQSMCVDLFMTCKEICFEHYFVYKSYDNKYMRILPRGNNCDCADYSFYAESGQSIVDSSVHLNSSSQGIALFISPCELDYFVDSGSVMGITASQSDGDSSSSAANYIIPIYLAVCLSVSIMDMAMQDYKLLKTLQMVKLVLINFLWIACGALFIFLLYCVYAVMILLMSRKGKSFSKLAFHALIPFGKSILKNNTQVNSDADPIDKKQDKQNAAWKYLGYYPLAFIHILVGIILVLTYVGIPFGKKHFEIFKLNKWPFESEYRYDSKPKEEVPVDQPFPDQGPIRVIPLSQSDTLVENANIK